MEKAHIFLNNNTSAVIKVGKNGILVDQVEPAATNVLLSKKYALLIYSVPF